MNRKIKQSIAIIIVTIVLVLPALTSYAATIEKPSVKWSTRKYYSVQLSSGYINCRTGPGTNYSLYGKLYNGNLIICDGSNSDGSWYHMYDGGGQNEAWVSSEYLVYMGDLET